MRERKGQKNTATCLILYASVFAIILILTWMTPLVADDYNYAFGYASGTRIRTLADIWHSMYWHRITLNGRVFSHGWVSLVLMYPRWVFAVLNALMAVLFTWTTIRYLEKRRLQKLALLATCIWMLLWICMPGFGQIFFWTSGACNYFWGITLAWLVLFLASSWDDPVVKNGKPYGASRSVLIVVLSFVTGAWSEHISFAMLIILFLRGIFQLRETKKMPLMKASALLAGGAGYLYLMLAPASRLLERLRGGNEEERGQNILSRLPITPKLLGAGVAVVIILLLFLWQIRKKTGWCKLYTGVSSFCGSACLFASLFFSIRDAGNDGIAGAVSSSRTGFFLSLSVLFFSVAMAAKRGVRGERIREALVLAGSGMASLALFLFGEYLPARAFCAPVFFALLASVSLWDLPKRETRDEFSKNLIAFAALTAVFAMCFVIGTADIFRVHRADIRRVAALQEAAAGDKRVILSPYPDRTKYSAQYGNEDLVYDAGWPNGVIADYYEIIRIIVVDED